MDFIIMFILPIGKDHLFLKTTQYSSHLNHVHSFTRKKSGKNIFF